MLSRKRGERIVIGTATADVVLEVVEIRNGKVRLGITAPKEVPVHREEIYRRIHDERPLAEVVQEMHHAGLRSANRPPAPAPAADTQGAGPDPTAGRTP